MCRVAVGQLADGNIATCISRDQHDLILSFAENRSKSRDEMFVEVERRSVELLQSILPVQEVKLENQVSFQLFVSS